jgi:hypothetical protein
MANLEGASGVVKMIGCLSAAAPRHILKSDSRISRNVFGEDRCQGFSAHVTHPAGTGTNDESNRLSLVKRRLGKSRADKHCQDSRQQIKETEAESALGLKLPHKNLLQ